MTASQRRQENDFFESEPWKDLGIDVSRLEIDALRSFLQDLLAKQIEKELPGVCDEIDKLLDRTRIELDGLGRERSTIGAQRIFLSELSMSLLNIIHAALDGNYHNIASDFFAHKDGHSQNRLRSRIHDLNSSFATYMRERSHKRKCGDSQKLAEDAPDEPSISDALETDGNSYSDGGGNKDSYNQRFSHLENLGEPLFLSKPEFDGWVKKVYHDTREQELPGNYNSAFLTELFHEQASRWPKVARQHVLQLHKKISAFIKRALANEVKKDHVYQEIHKILERGLRENLHAALDNIQKSRQDATKKVISDALKGASHDNWHGKLHVSNTLSDTSRLLSSMQGQVTLDMDQQACEEAKAGLKAYYKVDMKTFVDNVCCQIVEHYLVQSLRSILSPPMVLNFSDDEIARIASEPSGKLNRRKELKALEESLRESLFELRI